MRQSELNPITGREFRSGKVHRAGNWVAVDSTDPFVAPSRREIRHHGTLLGFFEFDGVTWFWVPVSTGWGSASDQQGCNKVVAGLGGWYYSRKGGAEWVKR